MIILFGTQFGIVATKQGFFRGDVAWSRDRGHVTQQPLATMDLKNGDPGSSFSKNRGLMAIEDLTLHLFLKVWIWRYL